MMTEEALSWIITMLEVIIILIASGVVGMVIGHIIHFGAGDEQDSTSFRDINSRDHDDLL
jgi:hypothetical protein